jgi:hypothetical protein
MKVDMSSDAVTRRLNLLDQLWELSVKLMRAKPEQSETRRATEESVDSNLGATEPSDRHQRLPEK